MPTRPASPCAGPGAGRRCPSRSLARGTRCAGCERAFQQIRNEARGHYAGDWQSISRRVRSAWVAVHGPLCPGWGRPPHWVNEEALTTDHVTARSASELAVLCRSCNARKGAR